MRYIQLADIRHTLAYHNPNSVRLYLHIAYCAAYQDGSIDGYGLRVEAGGYNFGQRSLANELGMSYQSLRSALNLLVKCGLVTQSTTQSTTQTTTQSTTHNVTHVTLVSINELRGLSTQPTTQSTTQSTTQPTTHTIIQENKLNNISSPTPIRARDVVEILKRRYSDICTCLGDMSAEERATYARDFARECVALDLEHDSESDLIQHCVSWCRKRSSAADTKAAREAVKSNRQSKRAKEAEDAARREADAKARREEEAAEEGRVTMNLSCALKTPSGYNAYDWADLVQYAYRVTRGGKRMTELAQYTQDELHKAANEFGRTHDEYIGSIFTLCKTCGVQLNI